jgi:hypothetical protein
MEMEWPKTADGDVFRRLQSDNFDFSEEVEIDINIDFQEWPPSRECVMKILEEWPDAKLSPPKSEDDSGYVYLTISQVLSYEFIVNKQEEITANLSEYGAYCNSWGLFGS